MTNEKNDVIINGIRIINEQTDPATKDFAAVKQADPAIGNL